MNEIRNDNQKEYKITRLLIIIPILLMILLTYLLISIMVNHESSFDLIRIILSGYLILLLFINYLMNLANSRYYAIKITDKIIHLERGEKAYEIPIGDIKRLIYTSQLDLSGITHYLIIITKGFKKNIFLSNYGSKKTDISALLTNPSFEGIKVNRFANKLIGSMIIFLNYIFFISI
ncbi:MAG: hypothetical protein Q7I99_09870 [Acholeplasmataceae bacterium]|nr:hypothetical protein [Acholeplasmataceae bacterium]